jgi:alanine racemase
MTVGFDVDLAAFDDNLRTLRARVAPAELMLVVKNDAYGHGAVPLAQRAASAGVRWFGAYDVRTARVLRPALDPGARLFVWTLPDIDATDAALALDADLGIGASDLLDEVVARAAAADTVARVHLKIDTGLHRNGFRPEEWASAIERAVRAERAGTIRVEGVWSHIAEASDAEDDASRALFDDAVAAASAAGLAPAVRHLAASAAAATRREFRYDLVRVGAFAYGVAPAGGPTAADLGLRPIGRLTAAVDGIENDGVRIGVGALDGLPSALAGRISIGAAGHTRLVRAVGRTHLVTESWPGAAVGDEVAVYGWGDDGEDAATALAEKIGTIGEEMVTRLSPLIERRYRG